MPVWAAYTVDKAAGEVAEDASRSASKNHDFTRPSRFSVEPLVSAAATKLGLRVASHDDYDDAIDPRYAGNLDAMGWYDRNSGSETHPVGNKQANAWGLSDMYGNVWEWCADWYGNYPGGSVTDPTGAISGSYRVYRGGGWLNPADLCRSASRNAGKTSPRYMDIGFRLALSSVP